MKIFFCFCFFCFSLSVFAQQESSQIEPLAGKDTIVTAISDSTMLSIRDSTLTARRDSISNARRDSILTARRDSIVNSIGKELILSNSKMEKALTAYSQAAESMSQVAENDEIASEEKSTQIKSIAEQRDATLKALLTDNQLKKLKAYIIRRKIPRKMK